MAHALKQVIFNVASISCFAINTNN